MQLHSDNVRGNNYSGEGPASRRSPEGRLWELHPHRKCNRAGSPPSRTETMRSTLNDIRNMYSLTYSLHIMRSFIVGCLTRNAFTLQPILPTLPNKRGAFRWEKFKDRFNIQFHRLRKKRKENTNGFAITNLK